jgi:hypothetical protein
MNRNSFATYRRDGTVALADVLSAAERYRSRYGVRALGDVLAAEAGTSYVDRVPEAKREAVVRALRAPFEQ